MRDTYDVIVVGAGTAGTIAAIQAGRASASTLLIEKNGICGGTLVPGGVCYPASFHAYGRQVIAGIGWELCCRARHEIGESTPEPKSTDWSSGAGIVHFGVNPSIFAALADEMLQEAGVEILFHAMPAAVRWEGGAWIVSVCTKTGLRTVRGKTLVDGTADANVVTLAGLGVDRNPELQAATLVVHTGGYDDKALDYAAIQAAFDREVEAGSLRRTDPGWGKGRIEFFLKGYGGNRIHIPNVNGQTSEGRSEAEIEGRKAMLRLLRFCRRQPGLENFTVKSSAMECGIRETVTIRARKRITVQDYETGRVWEDAVCYSFYAVDIHRADHVAYRHIKPGIYPTIPLGAMLPADSQRLIVAGRCVAGDWEANSAYRVEATCMAMGQVAGAAAALSAARGVEIEQIPLADLHALLRRHGAIVPGDLPPPPLPAATP